MLIFNKQFDLKVHLNSNATKNTTLGFVPTMGALHDGHLSLIAQSLKENEYTIMSIFVNPTQFNNATDLEKYPRTLEADVEKLQALSDKIIIYAPTVDDIYEGKTVSQAFDFDGLENQMEGKFRPGHFDGVGTIVKRLFEIVNPTNAYFGEKDFQQLQIVKKMVEKQKLAVKIIGNPIYREANGLAMSSRNERLTLNERNKAAIIYKILNLAKEKFKTKSANEVKVWVENSILSQTDYKIDYFEIADESTLLTCKRKIKTKKYRAFIAVFVNEIRLIDTISLN
jgi:pantoate--beta-alanine ligase